MESAALLLELDRALIELQTARGRLAKVGGADQVAREQTQRALINAQQKVELAQSEVRRLLAVIA